MSGYQRRSLAGAAVAVCAMVAMTGCAGGAATTGESSTGTSSTGSTGSAASAALPAAIRSAGVLRVGTNVPFVPMEQYAADGTTFTGLDLDLITAVAEQLGLKVKIANASWDGLIPSLNAGRYDVLASSFGDFVERQKVVDLVDMLRGGVSGIVRVADVGRYATPDSLCGATIAAETGSATVSIAKTLSADCVSKGKPAIHQQVFPTDAAAVVALQSGRVDVVLDDRVVAEHLAGTRSDQYGIVLPDLGAPFYYAFVVSKSAPQLSKAIEGAVNALIANGTYAKICATYGITGSTLVDKAATNAGTTSANDA